MNNRMTCTAANCIGVISTRVIKEHLYRFINQFELNLRVIENSVTIPLGEGPALI